MLSPPQVLQDPNPPMSCWFFFFSISLPTKTKTNNTVRKNAKQNKMKFKKSTEILLTLICVGQLLLGMGPALECG